MSDTYDGPERRSMPRVNAKGALAAYQKQGFLAGLLGGKKAERAVPVRNVSSSGACFLCPERLRLGQKLTVRLRLSEKGPTVMVVAQVTWCAKGRGIYPFRAGVQFVDFRADAWHILSDLDEHVVKRDTSSSWRLRARKEDGRADETPPHGRQQ